MKSKLLVSCMIYLAVVSISNAKIKFAAHPDLAAIHARAKQLIQSVSANDDTLDIPAGIIEEGIEAVFNGDTTSSGARNNVNRVYRLAANGIYAQYDGINIVNPTGTLTIIGAPGGTKPVIILVPLNGAEPGMNQVVGSVKLDNIHMQGMITDGTINNDLWVCSTANGLPQSVSVNNCLFEFISLDAFSCDGYTNGATFKFTNCYFRNYFNANQWWGGRVLYCKHAIDTLWVENCTVTDGGMIFLQQNSLCKFAYFNHNTIINSNKYWLLGVCYLEGYWVNNLFINQNWIGEDYYNVASTGDGGDEPGMLTGTIGLDTIVKFGQTKIHINVQPEFLLPDGTIDPAKCGLGMIRAYVKNNIQWTDTVTLAAYYHNKVVGGFGPYGTAFSGVSPSSYLTWTSPSDTPQHVVNVPGIWMNPRTTNLFATHSNLVAKDNWVNVQVQTVTPAIASAAVADQMARWDAYQWGVPGYTSSTNDITHSGYIYGDFDPTTIPGYKTEDGAGIAKFTDLTENFSQTGTVTLSLIDNLPVGALIWNDNQNAAYMAADAKARLNAVKRAYTADGGLVGVAHQGSGLTPMQFALDQNYPNPFNPSTTINFTLANASDVKLAVYNVLGQKVMTLVNSHMNAGQQHIIFDASKLSSGVYFYRLDAGNFSSIKKMMLLK
jgi:Secretion system C-terminal sorting domain